MPQFILPVDPDLKVYDFFVTLDGSTYNLKFVWNTRDEAFYLSIADSNEDPLVQGLKVIQNTLLLSGIRASGLFPGEILCLDTENLGRPPQLGELGREFEVLYIDGEDLAAL